MAEPKPIDEINGFQLTMECLELVSHAIYLRHLGFELPLGWWQDHIVEDPAEKLTRRLIVDGPVIPRASVSIFDSYDKCCVLLMDYTNAAYESFKQIMDRAKIMVRTELKLNHPSKYSYLKQKSLISRHSLCILESASLLTVVRHRDSGDTWVTLSGVARSWHYDFSQRPLEMSFDRWADKLAHNLSHRNVTDLINNYLAVNEPERFGGGA